MGTDIPLPQAHPFLPGSAFKAAWVARPVWPKPQQPCPHASAERAFDFWRSFWKCIRHLNLQPHPSLAPSLSPNLTLAHCGLSQHHPAPGPQESFRSDLEWLAWGTWLGERPEGTLLRHCLGCHRPRMTAIDAHQHRGTWLTASDRRWLISTPNTTTVQV